MLVGLDAAELPDADAAGVAHPGKVVPHEIDDHHVLGAVLFAGQQLGLGGAVDGRIAGSRPRSLDRPRLDLAIRNAKESFGRGADDLEFAQIEVTGERRRVAAAQTEVQRDGVVAGRGKQPLRKVHLENVAGVDVVDHPSNGLQVSVLGEIAGHPRHARHGVLGRQKRDAPRTANARRLRSPGRRQSNRGLRASRRAARRWRSEGSTSGNPCEMIHARPAAWSNATTTS